MGNNCNSHGVNEFNKQGKYPLKTPMDVSSDVFSATPETPYEMVNTYGTYEIQATADTENTFPAISQGRPSKWVFPTPEGIDQGFMPNK